MLSDVAAVNLSPVSHKFIAFFAKIMKVFKILVILYFLLICFLLLSFFLRHMSTYLDQNWLIRKSSKIRS